MANRVVGQMGAYHINAGEQFTTCPVEHFADDYRNDKNPSRMGQSMTWLAASGGDTRAKAGPTAQHYQQFISDFQWSAGHGQRSVGHVQNCRAQPAGHVHHCPRVGRTAGSGQRSVVRSCPGLQRSGLMSSAVRTPKLSSRLR